MDNMKCDKCGMDNQNSVLILKKHKFTKAGKQFAKCERVCIPCARKLSNKGLYDFGCYWRGYLLGLEWVR